MAGFSQDPPGSLPVEGNHPHVILRTRKPFAYQSRLGKKADWLQNIAKAVWLQLPFGYKCCLLTFAAQGRERWLFVLQKPLGQKGHFVSDKFWLQLLCVHKICCVNKIIRLQSLGCKGRFAAKDIWLQWLFDHESRVVKWHLVTEAAWLQRMLPFV